jgi:hypothetical protein
LARFADADVSVRSLVPRSLLALPLAWAGYGLALVARGAIASQDWESGFRFAVLASAIIVSFHLVIAATVGSQRAIANFNKLGVLAISVATATVALVALNATMGSPGFRPMPITVLFAGGFFALWALMALYYPFELWATAQWMRHRSGDTRLQFAAAVVIGVLIAIAPVFRRHVPTYAASEFIAHVGAVAAAVDSWQITHALPISSSAIRSGIEYPYVLLGNTAFYLLSAFTSSVLGVPPYIGAAITLAAGFAIATGGIFRIAMDAGVNRHLAVALGFLYATGPYLSVNLFVRNAFPEYLTWQTLPALFLAVSWALRAHAGPPAMLIGAFALAAPFYLHKLLAPHIALTLAILALGAAPLRAGTVFRLGLVGVLGVLFSVPGWYPAVRGLTGDTVSSLGGNAIPAIFHTTVINLFWPYASSSLPDEAGFSMYEGRFALQAGFVPLVGFVLATAMLLSQPQLAWRRRLLVPLALFVVNVVLVMGWFQIWDIAPSPLRYVQFAYRLIGLIHFLGYLLLLLTLGSSWKLLQWTSMPMRRFVVAGFVTFAVLSVRTYWHWPPVTGFESADIRATDLGQFDPCSLCPPTPLSSLPTRAALWKDRELLVPPRPIPVPATFDSPSVILGGAVPAALFESIVEPLTVRIYGFSAIEPNPDPSRLTGMVNSPTATSQFGTLTALYHQAGQDALTIQAPDTEPLRMQNSSWAIREPLAEVTVSDPGPFNVAAPMDRSIKAIAIECSRGVPAPPEEARARCIDLNFLAAPNHGNDFIAPKVIPKSRLTRRPLGGVLIDARKLKTGEYLLPTFDYSFVRVTDADGAPVATHTFDRRPVIQHDESIRSYTVIYDFKPEGLALLAGAVLFGISIVIMRSRRLIAGRRLGRRDAPDGSLA